MTKKLFCQLNHEYLPLQYFGDDLTKLGKMTKNRVIYLELQYYFLKDAGDSTFNQNLRQLTVFLFIAII